jgi:hypothetical protein
VRDHRQPEVEQPVGDDGEQGGSERDLDPAERERQQCLDDAGAAERERTAGDGVAGGVADDQGIPRRSSLIRLERSR